MDDGRGASNELYLVALHTSLDYFIVDIVVMSITRPTRDCNLFQDIITDEVGR